MVAISTNHANRRETASLRDPAGPHTHSPLPAPGDRFSHLDLSRYGEVSGASPSPSLQQAPSQGERDQCIDMPACPVLAPTPLFLPPSARPAVTPRSHLLHLPATQMRSRAIPSAACAHARACGCRECTMQTSARCAMRCRASPLAPRHPRPRIPRSPSTPNTPHNGSRGPGQRAPAPAGRRNGCPGPGRGIGGRDARADLRIGGESYLRTQAHPFLCAPPYPRTLRAASGSRPPPPPPPGAGGL